MQRLQFYRIKDSIKYQNKLTLPSDVLPKRWALSYYGENIPRDKKIAAKEDYDQLKAKQLDFLMSASSEMSKSEFFKIYEYTLHPDIYILRVFYEQSGKEINQSDIYESLKNKDITYNSDLLKEISHFVFNKLTSTEFDVKDDQKIRADESMFINCLLEDFDPFDYVEISYNRFSDHKDYSDDILANTFFDPKSSRLFVVTDDVMNIIEDIICNWSKSTFDPEYGYNTSSQKLGRLTAIADDYKKLRNMYDQELIIGAFF